MQTEQQIIVRHPEPDLVDRLWGWSLELTGAVIVACLTAYLTHHIRKRRKRND